MPKQKTFINNRPELEAKIARLKPIIELTKGFRLIAAAVNQELVKEGVSLITGNYVHRMYSRGSITDEYLCRLIIKHSEEHVKSIGLLANAYFHISGNIVHPKEHFTNA